MNTIFAKILYELEKKHDLMLVTIISELGSSPRGTGAQMLVGAEGRILGTVGGGPTEKLCDDRAVRLIGEKKSGTHEFRLHKNSVEDIGAVCGGDVEVYFQFIDGGSESWKETAQCVLSSIAEKKKAWLIQRTDGSDPSVLDESGNALCGAEVPAAGLTAEGCVLKDGFFSMKLPVGERAIIFGGGHCAAALAPLLDTVGFRVTVMDCREEYASRERFPLAEEVICGDYLRISDYLTITEGDYIIVMTNGHSFDYDVQAQVLRMPTAYVGVIGSKAKTVSVNKRLREAGVPEAAIESVHTPIGTAIKAVTPEEIAVSIAGEMILVRATHREAAGVETHGCPMH